jgi:hypothetical protein
MCNVGLIDRIIRVAAGLGLIAWGVIEQNWWGAVGIVPLATAALAFCPLYPILKLNTGCDNA